MKLIISSLFFSILFLFVPQSAFAIGRFDASDIEVTSALVRFKVANLDRSNDGDNGGYDGKVIYSAVYCFDDDTNVAHTDAVGVWNTNDVVSYTSTNYDGSAQNDCVIRLYTNGGANDYQSRQHFSVPTVVMTATPIPTITVTPKPFLTLPFDPKGKRFEQVALDPESWFDHSYPLQNISCCVMQVLTYTGEETKTDYRSHSGYDYALRNGVKLNTSVLAAADGMATYTPWQKSGGAGNLIKIDHGNHYQTWYEHLSADGLIVATEGQQVSVQKGQVIGKVGMTGNTNGPHIHFSVFHDNNINGIFTDDYPYGLLDPLGWESDTVDPWTEYSSGSSHGATSYNLFLERTPPIVKAIAHDTGDILSSSASTIAFSPNALPLDFTVTFKEGPFESDGDLISIVPSFFLSAKNSLGDVVSQFLKPVLITYNYADADLFNLDQSTLKLYHFNEQTEQWESLPTKNHDEQKKTISAETNHFSHFALMGKIKDSSAPLVDLLLQGDKGKEDWYRTDVTTTLTSKDNNGGVGVQYILYTLNENDWQEYSQPLSFEQEGAYALTYQSFDKANNKSARQTKTFHIDKTSPEAFIQFDQDKQDILIGSLEEGTNITEKELKHNQEEIVLKDLAGNSLTIEDRDREHGSRATLNLFSLSYNEKKITLDKNRFSIDYQKDKNGKIKTFTQAYEEKKAEKIKLIYKQKENKTIIIEDGKSKEVDDIRILRLNTRQGEIEYSYQ